MNEIYWITRLDGIHTFFLVWTIVLWILFGCALILYAIYKGDNEEVLAHKAFNIAKKTIIPAIISTFIFILVPTTKEAFAIYGIGGTIDYIKSNDKAKKLPDKVMDAVSRYLDSIATDKEKKKNKENVH